MYVFVTQTSSIYLVFQFIFKRRRFITFPSFIIHTHTYISFISWCRHINVTWIKVPYMPVYKLDLHVYNHNNMESQLNSRKQWKWSDQQQRLSECKKRKKKQKLMMLLMESQRDRATARQRGQGGRAESSRHSAHLKHSKRNLSRSFFLCPHMVFHMTLYMYINEYTNSKVIQSKAIKVL